MTVVPIVLAHEPPFFLGAVEVRPETRELFNDEHSTIVEPRVMQVLVALSRAQGHVVTKDDLFACCWDSRVVGDDALNRVISRLRQDAERIGGSFRVETITKVGYRLVIPDSAPFAAQRRGSPPIARRALLVGAGTLGTALVGGAAVWQFARAPRLPEEAATRLSEGLANMRLGTMSSAAIAVSDFRRAAALAPDHAETWGALAMAQAYQAIAGPPNQVALAERSARENIRRAQAIDRDEGYARAAALHLDYANGTALIEIDKALSTALRAAPTNLPLLAAGTYFLNQLGRDRASLDLFERWRGLEPDLPPTSAAAYGYTLYVAGREDEADEMLARLNDRWPRHTSIYFSFQKMLTFTRRYERALALIEDRDRRPLGIPEWNFDLSRQQTLGLADPQRHLDRALAMTEQSARKGRGFAANAMLFMSAAGRLDQAFAIANAMYLEQGFPIPRQRFTSEQGHFENKRKITAYLFEPVTRAMLVDPRFAPIAERLGFARYWRAGGPRPDLLV